VRAIAHLCSPSFKGRATQAEQELQERHRGELIEREHRRELRCLGGPEPRQRPQAEMLSKAGSDVVDSGVGATTRTPRRPTPESTHDSITKASTKPEFSRHRAILDDIDIRYDETGSADTF
jgi:hypothetical protein